MADLLETFKPDEPLTWRRVKKARNTWKVKKNIGATTKSIPEIDAKAGRLVAGKKYNLLYENCQYFSRRLARFCLNEDVIFPIVEGKQTRHAITYMSDLFIYLFICILFVTVRPSVVIRLRPFVHLLHFFHIP